MPDENDIEHFVEMFGHDKIYHANDNAIRNLIRTFPANTNLSEVLPKVVTINQLYSTRIQNPIPMAWHIYALEGLDDEIADGLTSCVERIGRIIMKDKSIYFYSFASKYCSWHNLNAYPIYDIFVELSLNHFDVKQGNLRIYENLKASVDNFREKYRLTRFTYKEIDKFLWLYGKTKLKKKTPNR